MIYGYWYMDDDDLPRLPEVSTINPAENEQLVDPYILFYVGYDVERCHDNLKLAVVREDDGLRWADDYAAD